MGLFGCGIGRHVISRCETACVQPTMTKTVLASSDKYDSKSHSLVVLLVSERALFSPLPHTYAVISCMKEVKQFFCALLSCIGSRVNTGFTELQTLLGMHTVLSLLTFHSYCFQSVLRKQKQIWHILENGVLPALLHQQSVSLVISKSNSAKHFSEPLPKCCVSITCIKVIKISNWYIMHSCTLCN